MSTEKRVHGADSGESAAQAGVQAANKEKRGSRKPASPTKSEALPTLEEFQGWVLALERGYTKWPLLSHHIGQATAEATKMFEVYGTSDYQKFYDLIGVGRSKVSEMRKAREYMERLVPDFLLKVENGDFQPSGYRNLADAVRFEKDHPGEKDHIARIRQLATEGTLTAPVLKKIKGEVESATGSDDQSGDKNSDEKPGKADHQDRSSQAELEDRLFQLEQEIAQKEERIKQLDCQIATREEFIDWFDETELSPFRDKVGDYLGKPVEDDEIFYYFYTGQLGGMFDPEEQAA